jgi:hypothetical protein
VKEGSKDMDIDDLQNFYVSSYNFRAIKPRKMREGKFAHRGGNSKRVITEDDKK